MQPPLTSSAIKSSANPTGAGATVILSEAVGGIGQARFQYVNYLNPGTVTTIDGGLYLHGQASMDLGSTVNGTGTLGGDGTVTAATGLNLEAGATLDPGVLDADNFSAGGQLDIIGDVDINGAITYAYRPGDVVNISGAVNDNGHAHTLLLSRGALSYNDLTDPVTIMTAGTAGTLTSTYTFSIDPDFGEGEQVTFTNGAADLAWDSANWGKQDLTGAGTATWVGKKLQFDPSVLTQAFANGAIVAADDALIPAGFAVTGPAGPSTVNTLEIENTSSLTIGAGGDLTITGALTLDGALNVGAGGAVEAASLSLAGGTIGINATGSLDVLNYSLTGGTITGDIADAAGATHAGDSFIFVDTGSLVDINGTVNISGDTFIQNTGNLEVDSLTTDELSVASGAALTSTGALSARTLDNSGSLSVGDAMNVGTLDNSGSLSVGDAMNVDTLTMQSGGTFAQTGAGAQRNVTVGNALTLNDSMSVTGGGALDVSGATVNINGGTLTYDQALTVAQLNLNGGALAHAGDVTVTGGLAIDGGSALTFTGAEVLDATGADVTVTNGSLSVSQDLTADNILLDGGTLTSASGKTVTAASTFEVDGSTAAFTGGALLDVSGAAATLTSGSLEVDVDFNPLVLNMAGGTLIRSGTAGNADVDLTGAGGVLNVTAGALDMSAGTSGDLLTDTNTDLKLSGGGTLTVDQAAMTVNDLVMNDASLVGPGTDVTVTIDGKLNLLGNATFTNVILDTSAGLTVKTFSDEAGVVSLGGPQALLLGEIRIDFGALEVGNVANIPAGNLQLDADSGTVAAVLMSQGTGADRFTRAIGSADGDVEWGDQGGGFAARGGQFDVDLGGAAAPLVWNTAFGTFAGDARVLQLSHGSADSRVKLLNSIDLGGGERTIFVADNTSSGGDIAEAAGSLTNGTLRKKGHGTVDISNAATALTGTNIDQGAVRISEANLAAGTLGAIDLTGAPTAAGNPVIETDMAADPLIVNGTGSPQIAFTAASVGISASDAGGIQVQIGDAATAIAWDTELNGQDMSLGSATNQGAVELLNPINLDGATSTRRFYVANNAGLTTDKGVVTIDTATTPDVYGIFKSGAGELEVNTNGVLGIKQHNFEVDAGTLTLAAGSTLRFWGLGDQNFRIDEGAKLVNKGEIISDMANTSQHELRFYGTGELVNEGTFTFVGPTNGAFSTLTFMEAGQTFRQTTAGTIDIAVGKYGRFDTNGSAELGSKVVIDNGADITITGNRDLYFQQYVGLDMTAAGSTLLAATHDGATGGDIFFDHSTQFTASADAHLLADGAGSQIFFRNGNADAVNPNGVAFTMEAINGGEIQIGGTWTDLRAVAVGNVFIGEEFYTGAANTVVDMDLSAADTPNVLLWKESRILVRNDHVLTMNNDLWWQSTKDQSIYTYSRGQFVLAPGATFAKDNNQEMNLDGGDINHVDFLNQGTVTYTANGGNWIDLQDGTVFKNTATGAVKSSISGVTIEITQTPGGDTRFENEGTILAEINGSIRFTRALEFVDAGVAAGSDILATNGGVIDFESVTTLAADTVITAEIGGRIEFSGDYLHAATPTTEYRGVTAGAGYIELGGKWNALQGKGIGDVRLAEDFYTYGPDTVIDLDLSAAKTPNVLPWTNNRIYIRNNEKLTLMTNLSFQSELNNTPSVYTYDSGQLYIPEGVTLTYAPGHGKDLRMNGSDIDNVGLLNEGTIRFTASGWIRSDNAFRIKNAGTGLVLSGVPGVTGTFDWQSGDPVFENEARIQARNGGVLRFDSNLHFIDNGIAAGSDILATGGGVIDFDSKTTLAADSVITATDSGRVEFSDTGQLHEATPTTEYRGTDGGWIELGGRWTTLQGIGIGDIRLAETFQTNDTNTVINMDLSQADTPGLLPWTDGYIYIGDGHTLTLMNNLSWQDTNNGNTYGIDTGRSGATGNNGTFVIAAGATFSHDYNIELRVDGDDASHYDIVNQGTTALTAGGYFNLDDGTNFQNDPGALVTATGSGGSFRRRGGTPKFNNLGTMEVIAETAANTELRVYGELDFQQVSGTTLTDGTYRVISSGTTGWNDKNATLYINDLSGGIDTIGADATVVISAAVGGIGNAYFKYVNTDSNVIGTVNGGLYVHGRASVDMASTVDGGVLGGDGTINVAGTLDVINGATLDPSVLDADASSAGGQLDIVGNVNIDVSAIKYSYQPGDRIDITGSLTHTTPTHQIILRPGDTGYGTLGDGIVVMSAGSGAPTGLWTVAPDPNFGGNNLYFTDDQANLDWDDNNWSRDGLLGAATAAYEGNELKLNLAGITEGAVNTGATPVLTDNVLIPGGFAVTGPAGTSTVNSLEIENTSSLSIGASGALTIDGALTLDGELNTGTGSVTAASIAVSSAGELNADAGGTAEAASLSLSGGTIGINATGSLNVLDYLLTGGTITGNIGDAAGATYSGASSIVVEGGGTVTIAGALTNTGQTTISGGSRLNTPGISADSLLVIDNGTLHDTDGGTMTRSVGYAAGDIQLAGPASFSADADLVIKLGAVSWKTDLNAQPLTLGAAGTAGKITLTSAIALSDATDNQLAVNDSTPTVDAVLSGVLSGGAESTKLVKSGDGTLSMTGTNTYVSDTEVLAGTLQVDDNSALGNAGSKVIVHGGATLSSTAWTTGVRTVEFVPGSAVTIDAQAGSTAMALELETILSVNTTDIVKTGAGTASITNGLALTGQIDVNEGTLGIGANLLAAPGGTVTIADGTTLEASGVVQRSVVTGNGGGNDVGTGILKATGDLTLIDFSGNHFQGVLDIGANTGTVIGPGSDPDVMLNKVLMAGGGSLGSNLQMRFRDHQSTLTGPPPGWVINPGIVVTGGGTAYLSGNVIFGEGPGGGVDIQVAPGTALIVDGVVDGAPNELPPFAGGGGTVTYTGWKRFGWSPYHMQRGDVNYPAEGGETIEIYGEADWTGADAWPGSDTEPYDSYDRTTSWGTITLPGASDGIKWEIDFVGWTPDGSGDETFEIVSGDAAPWNGISGILDDTNGVGKDNFSFVDALPNGIEWEVLVTEGLGGNMSLRFYTATDADDASTPEPGTMMLLAMGGIGVLLRRRRRRNA